ncbi:heptaketide hydrolyase ayg1 [Aspergillus clavatus NRRL 1]|uniref:Conidial pigment biosynthesis protein Ayg1 n=1 Tax=Aspergillus clavatus (strain ATCC 1007 / CBS 513.65 / DSM 816 / NCTC 3887 / NRRL 1 / QM 1276 / 107) TaxID=344612 RepID=A1C885_ASPCL|nr:conidial pigment biosynthesis protein Ayg1 [Aspergillus clavatus NRRL 1]EAW14606.1 conidial pigment biosynthesis protein Ayg1 [Aspergillus clavatus NRRL 1]
MTRWILGDKFDKVYPHKGSLKVLWESRWRFACQKSIYPFHDGCIEDFEPIFTKLIAENINDAASDEYTETFFPTAAALEEKAHQALKTGNKEEASNLLCRAAVVYRISRFPYVDITKPNSIKRTAFEHQKKVYLKATSLWARPIQEVMVPHVYRSGQDGAHIPIYIRTPADAGAENPVPVVMIMTGLDGYRPDNSQRTHEILARGWAAVVVEIPGTADSPADPADPSSPDRLWNSVLSHLDQQPALDTGKLVVWGLSAGGYYAIRAAHTHRERLAGSVAHGPGCHHYLDPEWLSRVNDHEYPFELTKAWATKHGYASEAEFVAGAQKKFSLVETGVVDQPSCRLLLLNGVDDGVVPIEDCLVLFDHGSPKEGRFFKGLPHMGYPNSLPVSYKWLEEVLALPAKVKN